MPATLKVTSRPMHNKSISLFSFTDERAGGLRNTEDEEEEEEEKDVETETEDQSPKSRKKKKKSEDLVSKKTQYM